MRLRQLGFVLVLVLFGLVAACGGGGGGGGPVFIALDLGLVSSTSDSSQSTGFTNPLPVDATVTLLSDSAIFSIDAGQFPRALTSAEAFNLPILVSPGNVSGALAGTIVLQFLGAFGNTRTHTYNCTAMGEVVSVQVTTASIDFGEVLPGAALDRMIHVVNLSTFSPARISPVTLPAGGFQVITALPLIVQPGNMADVVVRYAPTAAGAPSGNAMVGSEDPTGPFAVALTATTGGAVVTDFGTLAFETSAANPPHFTAQTDAMTFDVPADAVSFTVEAYCDAGTQVALSLLTGPGGENFEDESFGGIYLQYPDVGEFAALVPNSDAANLQIIPGTWTVRIGRRSGPDTDVEVRVIVERRPGGTGAVAVLDINVFLANAIGPTAANAASNATMLDIWSRVGVLLGQQGISIGEITYYDLTDPKWDRVTSAEFPDLLAESSAAAEERFNYFFVEEAIGGGILGVSAKLGGTTRRGTRSAGVMGLWVDNPSASTADLVARVTAHEMGHYLGLRHTAESSGTHDQLSDTTNFGAGGGGTYLMHWNASTGGSGISSAQGVVIRGHAHLRAGLLPPPPLRAPPLLLRWPIYDITVSENWCGTCDRVKSKHER